MASTGFIALAKAEVAVSTTSVAQAINRQFVGRDVEVYNAASSTLRLAWGPSNVTAGLDDYPVPARSSRRLLVRDVTHMGMRLESGSGRVQLFYGDGEAGAGGGGSGMSLPEGTPQHRAYVGNAATGTPGFVWASDAEKPTALLLKVTGSSSPAIKYVVDAPDATAAGTALGTAGAHQIDAANALSNSPSYQILEGSDGWFSLFFSAPISNLYFRQLAGTVTGVFCLAIKG